MKLYIAEKPSLARAIIDVLPKPHKKEDGYYIAANGDHVSWCIGHLLEQAEPHIYDKAFEKWSLTHLPIIPETWVSVAKPKTKKQLNTVVRLLKKASSIVHAGDPDREGQLLVDEVINHAKLPAEKVAAVGRVLISDLNPKAVNKAIADIRSNKSYQALSISALARSRADWLYGINLTRLFTLLGREKGAAQVLSVGRVQTPVLGMIVRRDLEIAHFQSKPFYEVMAELETENQELLCAKWVPSKACQPYMDDQKRVIVKALAENVVSRIQGQLGTVTKVEKKRKQVTVPQPYNLSALQIDANKAFGYAAKQVLDICQALYEKHKLITYPRSDNRFLPEGHFEERHKVAEAIKANSDELSSAVHGANFALRNRCWDDKKVEAHHAIIPTYKKSSASLSMQERNVYFLIARQYLMQFYTPYQYDETAIEIEIAGGLFTAKEKIAVELGFKTLLANNSNNMQSQFPMLAEGQQLQCIKGNLVEKQTTPPEHFTDATLLAAMTGVAKLVKDAEIKKILKDTDGLGTEATRAGIIDLLVQRRFVERKGKQLISSLLGRALINSLPEHISLPDRTALWESSLEAIAKKQCNYQHFIGNLSHELEGLVKSVDRSSIHSFAGLSSSANSFKKRASRSKFKAKTKRVKKAAVD